MRRLLILRFSFLRASDRAQGIGRDDPADRTCGETGLKDFPVGPDGKIGSMDDAAPFFPISAGLVGVFRDFQAVTNRERGAGLFDHFFRFVERVHGKRDDIGILPFEFLDVGLIIGYLPNTVGSPDTAIEYNDGIFAVEIRRNIERGAVDGRHRIVRKGITGTQLFCHSLVFLSNSLGAVRTDSVAP